MLLSLCAVCRYQKAPHADSISENKEQPPSPSLQGLDAGHSSDNAKGYQGKSAACSGILSDDGLTPCHRVSVGQAKADQNTYDCVLQQGAPAYARLSMRGQG